MLKSTIMDYNAKMGEDAENDSVGRQELRERIKRGKRLIELC